MMIGLGSAEGGGLRERLQPTIDHIAQQPGARKLRLALDLSDGFVFQVVVCNSSRASTALQLWLAEVASLDRGSEVPVERLSPYPLDPIAAGPASLEARELVELVLPRLVVPAEVEGRLTFIDAARAREADAEAWLTLFMRLNERRNLIARELGGPLTLLLPPALETDFSRFAPDLRSIRSVAVEVDDLDDAVSGTVLLSAYEDGFGRVEDIQALADEVERARTQAESGVPAVLRMLRVLLLRLVGAKRRTGELEEAERLLDEAAEIDDSLGDSGGRIATQLVRGDLLIVRGELDEAADLIESAIQTLGEVGDAWALANAWGRLADILYWRGELDEALRIRREEELPVYERLGDVRSRAVTMGEVADILQARGELDEALRIRREEELPVYERLGDVRSRAVTMGKVADILEARGELDEALRILRTELLPVFERLGDVRSRALTMGKVADILQARGELDEALRIWREEELPVYERLGDVRSRAVTMGEVADILQARGELDEALRIRREEELPVYERLGDVRELLVARANLALTLSRRQQQADLPEIHQLLALALRDARRLQLPETQQIVQLIRQIGGDPDAPPFT